MKEELLTYKDKKINSQLSFRPNTNDSQISFIKNAEKNNYTERIREPNEIFDS